MRNRKPKGPKLSIVFDEEKRQQYLTGFHKRKVERRKRAKVDAEARLTEEIKAVKLKYRQAARQRLAGLKIPNFPTTDQDTVTSRQENVIGNHTVTVEEIDISNSQYFVGVNKSELLMPDPGPIVVPVSLKLSLKAALKMNPIKKKKRRKRVDKGKTRKNKRR